MSHMKRTLVPSLILVGTIGLVVSFFWLVLRDITFFHEPTGFLEVAFLDVGQGDAIFIESPSGMQVLVDGGRGDGAVLRELPRVMGFFDRSIDMVVATHPDADHIGGLIDVFKRYRVDAVLMTDNVNDTPTYDSFMRAVRHEGAHIYEAKRGNTYDLGAGLAGSTTLTVLFPDRSVETIETNTASIIAQLSYSDADVLLTGDSPSSIERYLVDIDGTALMSEVLKVGHHGSHTSTDAQFLEMVRPKYGIISAGKDNSYGHPHREVMDLLIQYGVETQNTADKGTIRMTSDGQKIWFQ